MVAINGINGKLLQKHPETPPDLELPQETETIKLLDWKAKVTVEEFLCGCLVNPTTKRNRSKCFHGSVKTVEVCLFCWGEKIPRWVKHHEGQMKILGCV